MKLLKQLHLVAAGIALGLSLTSTAMAAAPAPAAPAGPSVVIVHGAFADGSDWAKVIPLLQVQGVPVVAVQNPLTSLADDVAATRRAIDLQAGKVVLVGHSWGGTVITEAGNSDKVAGLVYVAAFAPDAGQSSGEMGAAYPPAPGMAHITADKGGYLRLTPQGLAQHFAQDLPAATTAVMAATQGPIHASAFEHKVGSAPAWKSKPSWFVVSQADHMIQPALQLAMAQKMGAQVTRLDASHLPQQSRPAEVAAVILKAVASAR